MLDNYMTPKEMLEHIKNNIFCECEECEKYKNLGVNDNYEGFTVSDE